jgi:TonB family protein
VTFLIDFAIKSALILTAPFLAAHILRRRSASVRYALWSCALAALLILPALSFLAPQWTPAVARRHPLPTDVLVQTEPTVSTSVLVQEHQKSSPNVPTLIWLAGVIAMLARLAAGHSRVRSRFGKSQKITDPQWLSLAAESAATLGFRRTITLKRSPATDVPLTYGLFGSTVLLPLESEHWTGERRRIVLFHELIHARRRDSLWGLLAQSALAVNWFNPLAWIAMRRFRTEQERSCDDAVVLAGTASTIYAAHLVDLARSIALPEPALSMAQKFDLEGRIEALLDPMRERRAASRKVYAAVSGFALALIVPLAAVHAQTTAPVHPAVTPAPLRTETKMQLVALNKPVRRIPVREHHAASSEPEPSPDSSASGSVYDPSGAVIPLATITLKSTTNSTEEAAVADSAGNFKLQGIPAGEYLLKVQAHGFATYEKTVTLTDGAPAALKCNLTIGGGEQAVVITAKRPEPASAPSAAPDRIRVGGMFQEFNLIRKVTPMYPADARAEGVEGSVRLRAIVSKSGALLSIVPVSSGVDQRLVSAAVSAASQWIYQPALLNGEPVEVITTITMSFRLN